MTSHNITIAGYLVLVAAAVLTEVAARTGYRVPTLGQALSRVMRTRTGRMGMLVAWAWLGMHFFAR
jgi:hypothetical protein